MSRQDKLNSLLREVISETIRHDVKNPSVSELVTVTSVDITRDLRHAKVYISVIGDKQVKETTMKALEQSAGYIGVHSSKKMTIRYFPQLTFKLDDGVEHQLHIESLLQQIDEKKNQG